MWHRIHAFRSRASGPDQVFAFVLLFGVVWLYSLAITDGGATLMRLLMVFGLGVSVALLVGWWLGNSTSAIHQLVRATESDVVALWCLSQSLQFSWSFALDAFCLMMVWFWLTSVFVVLSKLLPEGVSLKESRGAEANATPDADGRISGIDEDRRKDT